MFEALKRLIAEFIDGDKHPSRFEDDDYRLAVAALLVHTALIDGAITDPERAKLHAVIKRRFDLDDTAVDELIAAATDADRQTIDLAQFTARLKRSLDEKARARMVEMMWQIVYADGTVSEFEDNLVWRAADLLGLSHHARNVLRERAKGAGIKGDGQ